MIDRCDPTIATWSTAGDNFVVKNVEKFASVSKALARQYDNECCRNYRRISCASWILLRVQLSHISLRFNDSFWNQSS